MNRRTTILLGGLLLLVGVGGVLLKPAFAPVADDAQPADDGLTDAQRKALQERILNTVRERGTLETADPLEIRCGLDQPSTILSVVRDGATVKKGDVLLRLDDSTLQTELSIHKIEVAKLTAAVTKAGQTLAGRKEQLAAQIAAGKLAVRAAELGRSSYAAKDGEFQVKLKAADAEVAVAGKRMAAAASVLNLLKANSANRAELAKAEAELEAATQAVALANAKKTLLTKHTQSRQAAEHEAAVARNQAESLHAKTDVSLALSKAEADLQSRKAELRLAQAKLARVNRQLKLCTIAAPRDGIVLHVVQTARRLETSAIEPGASVRPRQSLLQLPDLKRLQVRVKVHETRAHRIRKGQAVSLRFDAIPDTVFHGKVKSISRFPTRGEWPNTDLMLYETIVTIDKPSPGLRIGMSALAEIQVGGEK